jgi:hypothetical protein
MAGVRSMERSPKQKCLQPIPTPGHVALLLDASSIAESSLRRLVGRFRCQACGNLLLAAQFEMKAHLFFKVAPKLAASQQHGDSPYEFTREAHFLSLGRLDNAGNSAHDTVELGYLDTELLFACACEAVVAGAAIAGRHTPLRGNPAFD